jgi:membrane-anchored glycerophosphoryl diester phosphodiesterase (GDPDase)
MIEMTESFRPATLGEILDRTAQLYRRNFWLFAGVAALPIGAMFAISAVAVAVFAAAAAAFKSANLVAAMANPAVIAVVVTIVLIAVPIYIAAAVFSYAGLMQVAASTHRGEKITIRGTLKSVRPRFWRYLWFIILQSIFVGIIPALIAGGAVAALIYGQHITGRTLATATMFGFLIFFVVFAGIATIIWLALGYSLGLPVCVLEEKPAWESLQRAWKLSQGTRGRIFVMILLVIALAIAASMLAAIPTLIIVAVITAIGNGAAYSATALVVAEIVRVVGDFALQVLLAPISSIAIVLFYYDQRVRKEGFDIEWMMQQAGLAQPVSATLPIDGARISGPVGPPDTPS